MGIVNAGLIPIYEDIPKDLRVLIDQVILNKSENGDHVQQLIDWATDERERLQAIKAAGGGPVIVKKEDPWRSWAVDERLQHSLIKGIDKYID